MPAGSIVPNTPGFTSGLGVQTDPRLIGVVPSKITEAGSPVAAATVMGLSAVPCLPAIATVLSPE